MRLLTTVLYLFYILPWFTVDNHCSSANIISALFLRNYFPDMGQDPEVITAWMGLSEMLSSNRRAGLVTAWTQRLGQFTLTGDVKYVRLWDATKESAVQDLPTGAPSCVTCVERTSDGRLIAIGLGDGSARLLDTRCDPT